MVIGPPAPDTDHGVDDVLIDEAPSNPLSRSRSSRRLVAGSAKFMPDAVSTSSIRVSRRLAFG